MNVVLDSNVIVAAFATRGLCADIFELCLKECQMIISQIIIDEVEKTLEQKIKLPAARIKNILEFLETESMFVVPVGLPQDSCRDPNDIAILGTAVSGDANILITGDEDLLILKKYQNIVILSPRDFWSLMARKAPDKK